MKRFPEQGFHFYSTSVENLNASVELHFRFQFYIIISIMSPMGLHLKESNHESNKHSYFNRLLSPVKQPV